MRKRNIIKSGYTVQAESSIHGSMTKNGKHKVSLVHDRNMKKHIITEPGLLYLDLFNTVLNPHFYSCEK